MLLSGTIYSERLGMETSIAILGPKNYQQLQTYKVAYLLHGLGGSSQSWLTNTMLALYADKYQMVFVMPEVQRSFYADGKDGLAYFSYVADELPEAMQAIFKVSAEPKDTYVMGASMGGYGALKLALTYPQRFGTALAFSAVPLFMSDTLKGLGEGAESTPSNVEQALRMAFGSGSSSGEEIDLLSLMASFEQQERPNLYLSCGISDELLEDHRRFSEALNTRGWQFTYQELAGAHDWHHFNEALVKGLRWTRKFKN